MARWYVFCILWIVVVSGCISTTYAIVDESELNKLLEESWSAATETTPPTNTEPQTSQETKPSPPDLNSDDAQPVAYHEAAPTKQEDFWQVVNRMHMQWLTVFNSIEKFQPYDIVSRAEMAKFITVFSLVMGRKWEANPSCNFKDILQAPRGLVPYILSACNMDLLNGANGFALPNKPLTKAEAITVIIRVLRNDLTTNANPWYKNYYNVARAYGITNDSMDNMGRHVNRKEIAIMLWRACVFRGKCQE